ncbi:hypothetical protein PROFUN_16097, partial [Planoprotostelium fungivorum]
LAREDSERLKRMDEILSAKDTISVPLYGMGSTVCKAILATVKLTLTKTIDEDVQLDPENAAKMYTTYDLPKGKHSEDAIAAACTHLQNELTKFGVPFGIDDFEIRAVSTTTLWDNIKLGKFILSGGTDAVIVPGRLRVVVEFKDEEKLKSTDSQCIGELLCGLATSEHLVLVVKTDLKTRFDFWTPKDGSYSVWRCSNMQKAMQHISQFLLNSSKLALFRELNMDLPELRAMKQVRTAYDGGVVEDMLNIIPDLPKEERLPYYYKIIPYSGLRNSAYEKEFNAGHTNRAARVCRNSSELRTCRDIKICVSVLSCNFWICLDKKLLVLELTAYKNKNGEITSSNGDPTSHPKPLKQTGINHNSSGKDPCSSEIAQEILPLSATVVTFTSLWTLFPGTMEMADSEPAYSESVLPSVQKHSIQRNKHERGSYSPSPMYYSHSLSAGSSVNIQSNQRVLLDQAPSFIDTITVQGTLAFSDRSQELLTTGLVIAANGPLIAGTIDCPITQKVIITLCGAPPRPRDATTLGTESDPWVGTLKYGSKGLVVKTGGAIQMFGCKSGPT